MSSPKKKGSSVRLADLKKKDLVELAKKKKISGYSTMNKDDLLKALRKERKKELAKKSPSKKISLSTKKSPSLKTSPKKKSPTKKSHCVGKYSTKTREQLYKLAQKKHIDGRSNMSKDELCKALKKHKKHKKSKESTKFIPKKESNIIRVKVYYMGKTQRKPVTVILDTKKHGYFYNIMHLLRDHWGKGDLVYGSKRLNRITSLDEKIPKTFKHRVIFVPEDVRKNVAQKNITELLSHSVIHPPLFKSPEKNTQGTRENIFTTQKSPLKIGWRESPLRGVEEISTESSIYSNTYPKIGATKALKSMQKSDKISPDEGPVFGSVPSSINYRTPIEPSVSKYISPKKVISTPPKLSTSKSSSPENLYPKIQSVKKSYINASPDRLTPLNCIKIILSDGSDHTSICTDRLSANNTWEDVYKLAKDRFKTGGTLSINGYDVDMEDEIGSLSYLSTQDIVFTPSKGFFGLF